MVDAAAYRLADAEQNRQLVRIACGCCRVVRHFEPADLIILMGNAPLRRLGRKMVCQTCGTPDYMRAESLTPTAEQRQKIRVRRLKAIKVVRQPVWVDDE